MNSHFEADDQDIVLRYFRLIEEKDMHKLLSLFTEDCRIYEPFSKGHVSSDNEVIDKPLKGRSEIESFLHIVMMACDGLKREIRFESEGPFRHIKLLDDTVISKSPSIVSTLATFYRNERENRLSQKIIFHIVSEPDNDPNDPSDKIHANRENSSDSTDENEDIDNNRRRIRSLYVQFIEPK
jgi:hypothetical protein